jgi:thiosulfate dehydrogenase (quinone) large subunit
MKISENKIIEWFLRLALSAGLLSAVADRLGLWPSAISVWGNWENFIVYTEKINPLIPTALIPFLAYTATAFEIIFGLLLLTTIQTIWAARATGCLLLLFALAMAFSSSIKAPLDYSVFCASAGAFGLSKLVRNNSMSRKT